MPRFLNNLLYRRKDPTRLWQPDPLRVAVDLRACTLCGIRLGPITSLAAGLEVMGPSEDAKKASRGYLEWYSQGLYCLLDGGRLYDFTMIVAGGGGSRLESYAGKVLLGGRPVTLTAETTAEQIQGMLGEPFARSEVDGLVLFYEYAEGEVQYAFDEDDQALASIEFGYEPELAEPRARAYHKIEKVLPAEFDRTLGD